ncbi:unnamed protein product, partial [Strongylus vulgaris]
MKEHSSRLISEYNKKLNELREENDRLKESLSASHFVTQESPCAKEDDSSNGSNSRKNVEILLAELELTSSELSQVRENHKEALDLISSLKNEVSELNEKVVDRDRIIEEARGHMRSLEKISEQLAESSREEPKQLHEFTSENQLYEEASTQTEAAHCTNTVGVSTESIQFEDSENIPIFARPGTINT